ncbi:MAG TPA: hypothetical protein PLZ51_07000, partial [Aggregatilineales bacterium]|nr:hypothetical protein [Aggregatilineales bacterium]
PEIRKLAQQAGVYIRQKVGDIEPEKKPEPTTSKPSSSKRAQVDPMSAKKAQELMAYASYQSENG